jgi:hypothetical protein
MGLCSGRTDCLGRPDYEGPGPGQYWGFAGGKDKWQFSVSNVDGTVEVWADMFVGWTYNTWGKDVTGSARQAYMNLQMQAYQALFGAP